MTKTTFLTAFLSIAVLFAMPALAEDRLKLMAYGDSLVHGYGLSDGETFPDQLETALQEKGYQADVLNAGNSGDTSRAGLSRVDWALADNPDAVILVLGANDALRGLEPDAMEENLSELIDRFRQEDLPILLAGMMAPRNMGPNYTEEFDAVFPRLAEKHDVLFYPFFLKDVAAERDLNQDDGIHPNAEGVSVIVENILPKVEELIEETRGSSANQDESAS
ncbi:arylesterase [Fodinicurvata sediminis]|uniref:arylesterase n=1 Tax=Fodinicurvata sediminis TaxID=1121832 RepID=UPI0003B319FB|nr:arylesterase [Fodinicurvata sediminis]